MASPPYSYAQSPTALSPPYPSPSPLPNKKRSIDALGSQSGSSQKRRKASAASTASATAPSRLRTTSFPPPEARSPLARSPSVDAMGHVSGSQVSGTTAATAQSRKKRGRKAKNAGLESKEATPSLVGGQAPTVVSGAGGEDAGAAEEEEEHDGKLSLVAVGEERKEQKEQEIRMRAMLVEEMDRDQEQRYEVWRSFKFQDAVVRRVSSARFHWHPMSRLISACSWSTPQSRSPYPPPSCSPSARWPRSSWARSSRTLAGSNSR